MSKELVIIFVKNIKLGKVKTRLAKTVGNQGAFNVYQELVKVTEKATKNIHADIQIYFSESIDETKWLGVPKTIQKGENLGERMKDAFINGFENGYERIVLIGSDLPDINAAHIKDGLKALLKNDAIFGPAIDGGYYLIGLNKLQKFIFDNKPWSASNLLDVTLEELKRNNISYTLLEPLNDIDTFEDLITSDFYKSNKELQKKIKQLHD